MYGDGWGSYWDNPWRLEYGDTVVTVCKGWRTPTERLVRKATEKAIRRHDTGSVVAGRNAQSHYDLQKVAEGVVSEWGTHRG